MRPPEPRAFAAPALLLALALVLFRGAVAGGVLFERDVHLVWLPQVEVIVRALAAGTLPVWNASAGFGEPLLANPEAQVLYPFTWLNLLCAAPTFYTLYAIAHLWLGGLGVRALARTLKCSPLAATVAGALFMTAGPVLSLVNLWHHYAGACWMPWVLAAAERTFRTGRLGPALLWAAAQALQLLAGSADMSVATLLISAVRMIVYLRPRAAPRRSLRIAALAALAVLLAVGASAAQWWTTAALARGSARWGGMSEAARQYWSVHPWLLGQVLLPVDAEALPLAGAVRAALFEGREPFLRSLYLGLPAACLVACALAAGRRRALALGLLLACLLGALLALGRYAPVYRLAVTVVPPLAAFRYPVKAMVPVALAWALLAGLGIDQLTAVRRRAFQGAAVALGVGTVTALAVWLARAPGVGASLAGMALPALAGSLVVVLLAAAPRGRALVLVACAVAVGDLAFAHRHLNPVAPRALYAPPPLVGLLRDAGAARVYVYDYYNVRGKAQEHLGRESGDAIARVPAGWTVGAAAALELHRYLYPPLPAAFGLDGSFDLDLRGLHPAHRVQMAHLLRATEGSAAHLRLLQLASVDAVVARHQRGFEDLALRHVVPSLAKDAVRVYAVPSPFPRTYAVGTSRRAEDLAAWALLIAPDFDPRRAVVVADGPERTASPSFAGESEVVSRAAGSVRLRARLNEPGLVVLTEAWSEGWTASVDGRPAPVRRANGVFRAVELEAGEHRVDLVYRAPGLAQGALASAVSLLCGGALALVTRRRRQARRGTSAAVA